MSAKFVQPKGLLLNLPGSMTYESIGPKIVFQKNFSHYFYSSGWEGTTTPREFAGLERVFAVLGVDRILDVSGERKGKMAMYQSLRF